MGNPFEELDKAKLTLGHIKVMFVSGLGFFTDAYDLFVIGVVLLILSGSEPTSFHLTQSQMRAIGASSLVSAIAGQLIFGRIADIYGRKKIYGTELAILIIGAFLSSISWNFESLLFSRILLGVGIGGDYPVSATIMSEYSNAKDRGKLIGLVFSMQGFGAITAVMSAYALTSFLSPETSWRILLGIGALPPLFVVFFRRKIPETPRYSLLVAKKKDEALKATRTVLGDEDGAEKKFSSLLHIEEKHMDFKDFLRKFWEPLLITSLAWFLMDIAFYGTGIYSGFIVSSMIADTSLHARILSAGLPYFVGAFGYFIAAFTMDILGRKRIQIQGFIAMAAIYLVVSLSMVSQGGKVIGFTVPRELTFFLYSLSFFFINFGPNETTFVLPAELFPVKFRSTAHGIASAMGKLGAAVSTYLMPMALDTIGIKEVLIILAGISIVGAALSLKLKEPAGLSLEEISEEKILLKISN